MRAALAAAAILAGACGGPTPAPVIAAPRVIEAAPVRIALAPFEPAAWLEPALEAPIDDPFGDVTVVALGERSAIVMTRAGYFVAHLDLGVRGPITFPADASWIGVGATDDQVLVAKPDGTLWTEGATPLGKVKGATAWAASVHLIVAAAGERVFVSRTGKKFRSQRVAKGFAAQTVRAGVDGMITVTGLLAGETVTFGSKTGATWTRGASADDTCPRGRSLAELLRFGTDAGDDDFATVLSPSGPCDVAPTPWTPPTGTRSGLALVLGGVLLLDRVTGDARVVEAPPGCDPLAAWDPRGLRLLACTNALFTYVDGAWHAEAALDASRIGDPQLADDGTVALFACAATCGVRVRAPDGTWRTLALDDITTYRLLPGGDVIAVANGALVYRGEVLVAQVSADATLEIVGDTLQLDGLTVYDDGTLRAPPG